MKVLALDTATEACSAALWVDGNLTEHFEVAPQQHVRLLLPVVDQLMADAGIKPVDLNGVAFGCGPGSFTGVRIAVSAAQAIGFATGCPLVPVSTLAALAHRAFRESAIMHCLPMIDARMGQVYWGAYSTAGLGNTGQQLPEQVSDPSSILISQLPLLSDTTWSCVGSGYHVYQEVLKDNGLTGTVQQQPLLPTALDILHLALKRFRSGETVTADAAMPVYLRDKVASTEAERAAINK